MLSGFFWPVFMKIEVALFLLKRTIKKVLVDYPN